MQLDHLKRTAIWNSVNSDLRKTASYKGNLKCTLNSCNSGPDTDSFVCSRCICLDSFLRITHFYFFVQHCVQRMTFSSNLIGRLHTMLAEAFTEHLQQCFSTWLLKRNLPQMFALLMEPYAMIQVSILFSVINQMGKNVASMFYSCASSKPLAATRGTPVEKHWSTALVRSPTIIFKALYKLDFFTCFHSCPGTSSVSALISASPGTRASCFAGAVPAGFRVDRSGTAARWCCCRSVPVRRALSATESNRERKTAGFCQRWALSVCLVGRVRPEDAECGFATSGVVRAATCQRFAPVFFPTDFHPYLETISTDWFQFSECFELVINLAILILT